MNACGMIAIAFVKAKTPVSRHIPKLVRLLLIIKFCPSPLVWQFPNRERVSARLNLWLVHMSQYFKHLLIVYELPHESELAVVILCYHIEPHVLELNPHPIL